MNKAEKRMCNIINQGRLKMHKIKTKKQQFVLSLLLLMIIPVSAQDLSLPKIHTTVAVQTEFYFGEDDTILGYQVPDNKFTARYAAIELEGKLGKYVEYNLEMGTASCLGPGAAVNMIEAGIFFKPINFLKMGIIRGHIMRGFELYEECMDVLTAEKPRFFKTFAPCHPTGAVMDLDYDFTETVGFSAQLSYLNGTQKGTITEEHDMNLGIILRIPVPGLSIGGFYTDMQQDFEFDEELDKASRNGFGLNYDAFNVHLRGEYYLGKGFFSIYPDVLSEDLEMRAFFFEGAYMWETGITELPYVEPYVMYQSWDKGYNVEGDQKYTYITAGLTLGLGSPNTKLRIDYEIPREFPDDTYEEASRIILRLQVGY